MKISLDWISDYVDLSDISVEMLTGKLTMSTAETEGFEEVRRYVDGLKIVEIIFIESIGKNYKVVVDAGINKYTTVCGAPNIRIGLKTVFAPVGSILSNNIRVDKIKKDGCICEGILCSAKEIGLSDWHEVILECPDNIPNGADLKNYITEKDYVIEIDNKSITHRPDLWGHYGFAREIAAIFDRQLVPLGLTDLRIYDNFPKVQLYIDKDAKCQCYCAIRIKIEPHKPAPLLIQRRLHAIGQRTIDLIVDLTNYVMFDIGQPMHAFDSSILSTIKVAPMRNLTFFTPLDNLPREMKPDDLMIWDKKEPIAIAGIMGGKKHEVTKLTNEILLESANFKGSQVRKTALRLDLRTDASQRFEKDQPPYIAKIAIARILNILQNSDLPFKIISSCSIAGDLKENYRFIKIPKNFFSKKSGVEIELKKAFSILNSLGFDIKQERGKILCGIPPFRSERDLSLPIDIVEEVLRIYGYDNIHPILPIKPIEPVSSNIKLDTEHRLAKILTIDNFFEIHTYSWYDKQWLSKIHYSPNSILILKNPTENNNNSMRKDLIPNLLEVISRNVNYNEEIKIFEIGRVFEADQEDSSLEKTELSGVFYKYGKLDVFTIYLELKGIVEKLGSSLGLNLVFEKGLENKKPWCIAGLYTRIISRGANIGFIGILPKELKKEVCQSGQAVWFTLDLSRVIEKCKPKTIEYETLPAYPGSTHDFSILWEKNKGYFSLAKILDEFKNPYIANKTFITYFEGGNIPEGMISYTFRYLLQSDKQTLSADDIEDFRSSFMKFLNTHGITIR